MIIIKKYKNYKNENYELFKNFKKSACNPFKNMVI